jgi:signal transduction histidine kinase
MNHSPDDLDALRKENAELRSAVEQHSQQVELLRSELAETNQGVVALYAELDDQAAALREAAALKSRFLSYMSHEFRTPLGSIRSLARIMLDRMDGPLTAEQEKQLQFIQGSAIELSDMVNDLLDLARLEAGRLSISAEWFEMVDLFGALRGMFKPLLAQSSVALILEEPVDLDRLFTDHKKLSQILRNFISNALKFTPEGEVRVAARRVDGDRAVFSVTDTGIGIAPEHHETIFQDFVQVDSHLQKRVTGSGLGLALSKKIAELLGGQVSLISEPGVGSTFSLTLPIRLPTTQEPSLGEACVPRTQA